MIKKKITSQVLGQFRMSTELGKEGVRMQEVVVSSGIRLAETHCFVASAEKMSGILPSRRHLPYPSYARR